MSLSVSLYPPVSVCLSVCLVRDRRDKKNARWSWQSVLMEHRDGEAVGDADGQREGDKWTMARGRSPDWSDNKA